MSAVTPAAMAGQIHHVVPVSTAVPVSVWEFGAAVTVSAPPARRIQPQTCAAANSGARTRTRVTATPNSSDSTPARTVLASGAR